jgi:hypothetical protein
MRAVFPGEKNSIHLAEPGVEDIPEGGRDAARIGFSPIIRSTTRREPYPGRRPADAHPTGQR